MADGWKIENDRGENISVKSSADAFSMVRLMLDYNEADKITVTRILENKVNPRAEYFNKDS